MAAKLGWEYTDYILGLMQTEKGKSQIKRGDMKQIVGIIADSFQDNPQYLRLMLQLGEQRKSRKKKK